MRACHQQHRHHQQQQQQHMHQQQQHRHQQRQHSAPARRRSSCRPCCAAAADADPPSLLRLPLFPLPNVLMPAQAGTLLVYEPRYLALFRDLLAAAPAGGSEPRFGHVLAPGAAPPALLADGPAGAWPPLGVAAAVKGVTELDNGRLQIKYQGLRRFKLLSVDQEAQPYPLAAGTWVRDEPPGSQADALEQDVLRLLQQVARYSRQLAEATGDGRASAAVLPDAVLTYAPPPDTKQSIEQQLMRQGVPAGAQIATYKRMGSVYGSGSGSDRKRSDAPAPDPYQAVAAVAKAQRQELFSFAALQVLELGVPERLALLQTRDTAARLQFAAAAAQPFLQDLVARVSVGKAMSQ